MTWGEIQIESLKKMFLNTEELTVANLATYKTDKKYKTYLFAMPQACNEAVNYIASRLGTEVHIYQLTREETNHLYDLSEISDLSNLRKVKDVICPAGVNWKMITKDLLQIDGWESGDVYLRYEITPPVIADDTAASTDIGLKAAHATIVPLYIAGELYKDDDLSMSTMYMNEFFNMINAFEGDTELMNNPTIATIYRIE
jgi:hypothetical protein